MSAAEGGFAVFRGTVDRRAFAPGFVLWTQIGEMLLGTLRTLARPVRGRRAAAEELPPEYFRFPPF